MVTDIDHLFIDTCTIQRNQPVSDGQGGWTETLKTVASAVPCRIEPAGERFSQFVTGEQERSRTTHVLRTRHDVDIEVNDTIQAVGDTFGVLNHPIKPSVRDEYQTIALERFKRSSGTI